MSAIRKGDLVMVVRNEKCGCESLALGLPFVVLDVEQQEFTHCAYCLRSLGSGTTAILRAHDRGGVGIWRLIKIDPPKEGESIERHEELTA